MRFWRSIRRRRRRRFAICGIEGTVRPSPPLRLAAPRAGGGLRADADRCHAQVEGLAWNLEDLEDSDDDEGEDEDANADAGQGDAA